MCAGEQLPYTLALHRGGPDGENPHAHLMFSERGNDGIARSKEQWFKRHNPTAPAQGGARKSRAAKAGDWLDTTRQAWEQTANRALEQAGRAERAAALSREPNVHLGEFEQRLTDEFSKLAEQYAQEQMQLREQVNSLGGYVQKLERQVNASAKQHREEVNKLTERVDDLIKQHAEALLDFQTRCNTLVGDVNAFARLLEEEWK